MTDARTFLKEILENHAIEIGNMSKDLREELVKLNKTINELSSSLQIMKEDYGVLSGQILVKLNNIEESFIKSKRKTSRRKVEDNGEEQKAEPKEAFVVVERNKRSSITGGEKEYKKESEFHKKVFYNNLDEMKAKVMSQTLTKAENTKLTELFDKAQKEIVDNEAIKSGKSTEGEIVYKVLGKNTKYKKYVSDQMKLYNENVKSDAIGTHELDEEDSEVEEYKNME